MTDAELVMLEHRGLTPREAEVLAWVAQGKSNDAIGTILDISPRTVQKHLERVFAALGVESRTAASAWAFETLWKSGAKGRNPSRRTSLVNTYAIRRIGVKRRPG